MRCCTPTRARLLLWRHPPKEPMAAHADWLPKHRSRKQWAQRFTRPGWRSQLISRDTIDASSKKDELQQKSDSGRRRRSRNSEAQYVQHNCPPAQAGAKRNGFPQPPRKNFTFSNVRGCFGEILGGFWKYFWKMLGHILGHAWEVFESILKDF